MKTKYLISTLLLIILVFSITAAAQPQPRLNGKFRVIAHSDREVSDALAKGCKKVRESKFLKALVCSENIASSLGLQEDVRVFAMDSAANTQIKADLVQSSGNTGNGRKVVVLDTGYNYNHPELSSSYLGGKDFVNDDNDPIDDDGHGSHVAGIITADGVNSNAKGVAPSAGVIAGKVLDASGSGYFSDVVAAVYWAVDGNDGVYGTPDDFNADAISLSLGTGAPYLYSGFCDGVLPDLTNAIKYARSKGVLVVVAAGNSGSSGVSLPGCISYSTTVGAVNSLDAIASFSGRGNAVDATAPGVSIYSSVLGTGYASWSGTSMATPMVTGAVALIRFIHPDANISQIESSLFNTAKDLGTAGKDTSYGWGRINAEAAVNYLPQTCTDIDQDNYCAETNDCNDNNVNIHPGASDVICDGIDNNCNNLIDENYVSYTCGTGACQAQSTCVNGTAQCIQGTPATEDCNGVDDDCDGIADDNLVAPLCENQVGVCLGSTKSCGGFSGWLFCGALNYGPNYQFNESSCSDTFDNDCDGATDSNDFNCLTCIDNDNDGYGTNCALGNDCNDNDNAINPGASDANCNNIDEDCDGTADDAYVATQTNCGVGACASNGLLQCQSGALVDTCTPGTPTSEVCNSVDDDCDGTIDDGNVCAVKCWSAANLYLARSSSQFRKFCKCAQGTYAYVSYGSVSGTKKAYKYVDANNNNNWATTTQTQSSPASRVRCSDNVLYYTNKDYYR